MNENINLGEILKNCPEGWILFSPLLGFVRFLKQTDSLIWVSVGEYNSYTFYKNGHYDSFDDSECLLFPSKEQRDWSKFEAPWYKPGKQRCELFDQNTFQLLEKVLVRDEVGLTWKIDLFSNLGNYDYYPYVCVGGNYNFCIPYNEETKHLLGSDEDEPEYYRFAREWQKNKQN